MAGPVRDRAPHWSCQWQPRPVLQEPAQSLAV